MRRILLVIIALINISCERSAERIEKDKEYWITGTLSTDKGISSIFFHDCYCNLVNSKIIINYVYFGGVEGGSLTATIADDGIHIDLSYMLHDLRTFYYDKKEVSVNEISPKLGETITGKIALIGQSQSRLNEIYKFNLKGNFRCVLRDSTYDHMTFYIDILNHYDSIEMVKLKKIAYSNPDSVAELSLQYRNFDIIKNELKQFRKLNRIALSDFPSLEGLVIPSSVFLKELSIDSDSLRFLPTNISTLKNLEVLTITAPITKVPNLYNLTRLKELDLGGTNITVLSDSIKNLKELRKLTLGHTRLKHIPNEIFELENLTHLDLPKRVTPFRIRNWNLCSLKRLDISHDLLSYNQDIIEKLKELDWLYITYNRETDEDCDQVVYNKEKYFEKILPNVSIQVRNR